MREQKNIFQNLNWITVGLYFALVLIGWLNIYASLHNDEHKTVFDFSQFYGKQMIWIGCAPGTYSYRSFDRYKILSYLFILHLWRGDYTSGGGFDLRKCHAGT